MPYTTGRMVLRQKYGFLPWEVDDGGFYSLAATTVYTETFNQTTNTFGSLSADIDKWLGGVLAPNGKIYGIPRNSTTVLEIDPSDNSTNTFGSLSGTSKWFVTYGMCMNREKQSLLHFRLLRF